MVKEGGDPMLGHPENPRALLPPRTKMPGARPVVVAVAVAVAPSPLMDSLPGHAAILPEAIVGRQVETKATVTAASRALRRRG